MSEKNGVLAITDRILADAKTWAEEQESLAKSEADSIIEQHTAEAKEIYKSAIEEAKAKAAAIRQRADGQGEMDKRKMILAARQKCIGDAFDRALAGMCALPDEERVLFMVKNAVRYQTGDAEYIFNAADQAVVGPLVVETVNSIFKKEALKETFSGTISEQVKKLFAGSIAKHKAEMSKTVGSFAGGFILKQGDIESNCTFEVLIGGVREKLEGEAAAILFK